MHKTPGIREGQKQCTKLKQKETHAFRERGASHHHMRSFVKESTFEPMSEKQKRVGVKGF
jgi:ribosomal protein L34